MAESYSNSAYELNPNSEDAALLYGFVQLNLAGADPFTMAKDLMQQSDSDGEEEQQTSSGQTSEETSEGSSEQEEEGTSDTLGELKSAIGLSDKDLEKLGTLETTDPDLPVLIPSCAEKARADFEKLRRIHLAIRAICPFVNSAARVASDYRQQCASTKGPRKQTSQAHFLWAFAHLTEALAFNSALTYGSDSGGKSNLEKRVEKVTDTKVTDASKLTAFIATVTALEALITSILPIEPNCSPEYPTTQLVATLNDMLAVDAAFAAMPGLPSGVTGSITKSMEKIKELQTQSSGVSSQTNALKGDLTKSMSKGLSEKIQSLETESGSELSASEKADVCAAYDSIASGGESEKPSVCEE